MFTYPHTIDNGLGERIIFLGRSMTPEGDMLHLENYVQPGMGPPMHVHYFQEEGFTVRQGRVGYQTRGSAPRFAGVGETVSFQAGESHRFWNAGDGELQCTGYIRPPGNVEYFLRGLYEAQKRSGSERPDAFEAAYLMWRYRSEFGMEEIPALVRRVVLPTQVLLGRLLRKYGKFADAPAAVTVEAASPKVEQEAATS